MSLYLQTPRQVTIGILKSELRELRDTITKHTNKMEEMNAIVYNLYNTTTKVNHESILIYKQGLKILWNVLKVLNSEVNEKEIKLKQLRGG